MRVLIDLEMKLIGAFWGDSFIRIVSCRGSSPGGSFIFIILDGGLFEGSS